MSATVLHAPPRWRNILREQTRATGLQLRAVGIFLAGVMVLLAALAMRLAWMMRVTHAANAKLGAFNITYAPQACRVLVGAALLLPLIIWQDEDPTNRAYHWAMPVSRTAHALTKTLAGWIWIMAATVSLLLTWVAITIAAQAISGIPQRHDPGFTWWEWLVTPAAVTIAYLFASAAAVGARRPIVWIFGLPLLYTAAAFLFLAFGMVSITRGMATLYSGFLGVEASLAGGVEVVNSTSGFPAPSIARWLGATGAWGGAGLLLLYLTAAWRRERAN